MRLYNAQRKCQVRKVERGQDGRNIDDYLSLDGLCWTKVGMSTSPLRVRHVVGEIQVLEAVAKSGRLNERLVMSVISVMSVSQSSG